MKFKDYINYLLETKIFESSRYIGSCVDIGDYQESGADEDYMDVCDIYSDATELAQRVWEPGIEGSEVDDRYFKEITKEEFFKYIDPLESMLSDDPKFIRKIIKGGKLKYFYDTYRNIESPSQANIFYIYNEKDDIHYFFKRT